MNLWYPPGSLDQSIPKQTFEQQRSALTNRIYETPCPKCGGELSFSEHTIAVLCLNDEVNLWNFCNRHTFPYCKNGCGNINFCDVVPFPKSTATTE